MASDSSYKFELNLFISQSMEVFGSRRKMGGEEGSAKYKEQLEGELEELYGHYKV